MKHKIVKIDTVTIQDTISFKNSKKTLSGYMRDEFVCSETNRYMEGGIFPTNYQVTKIKLFQTSIDPLKDRVDYNVEIYGKKLSEKEFEAIHKKVKNG